MSALRLFGEQYVPSLFPHLTVTLRPFPACRAQERPNSVDMRHRKRYPNIPSLRPVMQCELPNPPALQSQTTRLGERQLQKGTQSCCIRINRAVQGINMFTKNLGAETHKTKERQSPLCRSITSWKHTGVSEGRHRLYLSSRCIVSWPLPLL
jgi:hypothetical protein